MIRWGKTRRSFSSRRVGKSGALDPSTGYALYLPFSAASPTYRSGATTSNVISGMPGYSDTRSGAKQELLASAGGVSSSFAANVPGIVPGVGYYSWAAVTNLLLNAGQSSNLVTQNVTTIVQTYTLSFLGTGTVTLSGTSVAGPLVGTGANNQVSLTFTPTAGTLTLTVTGNVTYSGLVAGNVTGPIIATAGATASTGGDNLTETMTALTDQDMIAFIRMTPQSVAGAAGMLQLDDGTDSNGFVIYNAAGTLVLRTPVAGINQLNETSLFLAAGVEITAIIRRLSGQWRGGKYVAGTLTWGAAAVAGTFPPGVVNIRPGSVNVSALAANGSVATVAIKLGTFTSDASVIAALA